jgi:UDP-N-acetylmuramate--alanine ligase
VVCGDDPEARAIGESRLNATSVRFYGLQSDVAWRAEEVRPNFAGGVDFLAVHQQETLGLVRLRVPGAHNAANAVAALAVTDHLGIPFRVAREALREFHGVARRFELKGEARGVVVVDDYAHHPTEIQATLRAARGRFPDRRIWAVWQPHTYSRTKQLQDAFASSFDGADEVIVLPIYAAREADTLGVQAADVVEAMAYDRVRAAGSMEEAVGWLRSEVEPGDVVLTLGAGDGYYVGERLLAELRGWTDGGV